MATGGLQNAVKIDENRLFFDTFCNVQHICPRWAKMASRCFKMASRWLQNGVKIDEHRCFVRICFEIVSIQDQDGIRWLEDASRWFQDGAQDGLKIASRCNKSMKIVYFPICFAIFSIWVQDGLRWPQGGLNMASRWLQDGFKMASRCFKMANIS